MSKKKSKHNKKQQQHQSKGRIKASPDPATTPLTASKPSSNATQSNTTPPPPTSIPAQRVQPEQMSLLAYQHIQTYLDGQSKSMLPKDEVTAVLRLSQHLRLFGLLSAVGYINQLEKSGDDDARSGQSDKVRRRTIQVWESLLGQFLRQFLDTQELSRQEMMKQVADLTKNHSRQYLAAWRKAMVLAHHWNFWARAYQEEKCKPNDPKPNTISSND
jgi:hypothetical protein